MGDGTLTGQSRRSIRLAISDDVRDELRELRKLFLALHREGDIPAYRFQHDELRSLPDELHPLVHSMRELNLHWSRTENGFGEPQSSAVHADYAYCVSDRERRPEIDAAFARLSRELGLSGYGGKQSTDFPSIFQFLVAALTPSQRQIRCRVRSFTTRSVAVSEAGLSFGWHREIVPGLRAGDYRTFGEPIRVAEDGQHVLGDRDETELALFGVRFASAEAVEPVCFFSEIREVCFAVCEALDALVDGRLAQRPLPSPWTDDPSERPDVDSVRCFRSRYGMSTVGAQVALAHILRTFYEPDDVSSDLVEAGCSERVESRTTTAEAEQTCESEADRSPSRIWNARGELVEAPTRFGGRSFRQWADDVRRLFDTVPSGPTLVPDFDVRPAVQEELELRWKQCRDRAIAGDLTTYRIQATTDRRDFAEALDAAFGDRHLESVWRFFRDSDPRQMRRLVYVRDESDPALSHHDLETFAAAWGALGIVRGPQCDVGDWLDFVHGFGWFPFDAIPFRAERFVADSIVDSRFVSRAPTRSHDADGIGGRSAFCKFGPPKHVRQRQVIEDWLEPVVFVSKLPRTFAASAAAIRALLDGALAKAPLLATSFNNRDSCAIANDLGSHVADWVRTAREALKFYRNLDAVAAVVKKPFTPPTDEVVRERWLDAKAGGATKRTFANLCFDRGWLKPKHKGETPIRALDRLLDRVEKRAKRESK